MFSQNIYATSKIYEHDFTKYTTIDICEESWHLSHRLNVQFIPSAKSTLAALLNVNFSGSDKCFSRLEQLLSDRLKLTFSGAAKVDLANGIKLTFSGAAKIDLSDQMKVAQEDK